jgi:hypothetical protein
MVRKQVSVDNLPAGVQDALGGRMDLFTNAQRALRHNRHLACWGCGKLDTELKGGKKLSACSRCRQIGRKVLYCSG